MLKLNYIDTIRYEAGRPKALFLLIDTEMIKNLKVAIWGNGIEAYLINMYLQKIGVKIECFINSDIEMTEKTFCGKCIRTPDQIYKEKYFVIIAMTQPRYNNEGLWQLKVHNYNYFGLAFIESFHAFNKNESFTGLQDVALREINHILFGEKNIHEVIKPVTNVGPAGNLLGDIPELCWTTTWSNCILEWFYKEYSIETNLEMLEIGPGKGLFSAVVHDICPNIKIQWLMFNMNESSMEAVKRKYEYYPANQFETYYGMIEDPNYHIDKKFHIIVMTEVFEHFVNNPVSTIKKIAGMLHKDGKFYISTPAGRHLHVYEDYKDIPEYTTLEDYKDKYVGHTYEYSKAELEEILNECGLEIEKYALSDSRNHNLVIRHKN